MQLKPHNKIFTTEKLTITKQTRRNLNQNFTCHTADVWKEQSTKRMERTINKTIDAFRIIESCLRFSPVPKYWLLGVKFKSKPYCVIYHFTGHAKTNAMMSSKYIFGAPYSNGGLKRECIVAHKYSCQCFRFQDIKTRVSGC